MELGPSAVPVVDFLGWEKATGHFRVVEATGRMWTCDPYWGEWRSRSDLGVAPVVSGIAVGSSQALLLGKELTLWDLDSRAPLRVLPVEAREVRAIAVSADGRLAAIECGGLIHLYSLPAGDVVGAAPAIGPIAVSSDGELVVARSPEGDRLVVLRASGSVLASFAIPAGFSVGAVIFNWDGRAVVAGLSDGSTLCWDLASGTALRRETRAGARAVVALERSPDGRTYFSLDQGGTLSAFLASGRAAWRRQLREWRTQADGAPSRPWRIAASPHDGEVMVAVVIPGNAVRCFYGREAVEPRADRDLRGVALAVSQEGRFVAIGGTDGVVRVDDLSRGETAWTLDVDETEVVGVEFLPDRHALRTCGRDGVVRRWNLITGVEEAKWPIGDSRTIATQGSLDGSRFLALARGEIALWSEASRESPVWSAVPSGGPVGFLCFADRESRVYFVLDQMDGDGCWMDALWVLDAKTGAHCYEESRFFSGHVVGESSCGNFVALQATVRGPLSASCGLDQACIIREEWGALRKRTIRAGIDAPRLARFSTDGRWLMLANATHVSVCSIAERSRFRIRDRGRRKGSPPDGSTPVATIDLSALRDAITTLAVSADGSVFAVGTAQGQVLVFERSSCA
ncbi:MAG: repeat, subgroup [Myxococcaceae bacterium]|nr:repeat, subgroup [Myxococcaceae bacterium]